MRAGGDRNTAWGNFAERLGLEEARSLATMLKQSEELGTSIGETLRVYGSDMREKRMLRAEEKGPGAAREAGLAADSCSCSRRCSSC